MSIFRDFDELKAAVGAKVEVSDWIDVTQGRIDQFAQATGDDKSRTASVRPTWRSSLLCVID